MKELNGNENHSKMLSSLRYVVLKFVIVLIMISCFMIYRLLYQMDFTSVCVYDYLHEILYPINRYMNNDTSNWILLLGQLLMDGFILFLMVYWLFCVKTARIINIMSMFYAIRTIVLQIWLFPFPDDIVWRPTMIPSLFVPYDHTRDFFFSGHTGIATLIFLQISRLKLHWIIKYLSFFTIIWMPVMLITSRIHYTIDVLAAPFFSFQIDNINLKLVYYSDMCWSVPLEIGKKISEKCCKTQQENNKLIDDQL